MKIGILTFEKYEGRENIGSSRIRGRWLAKYWDEAEIFVQGQKYDVVIYQKAYFVEHAKIFKGIKILDLCDPDYLHWGYRTKAMIEEVDIVTTSTEALAEDIRQFTDKPVFCVPDRIDLDEHRIKKVHTGRARDVVWFGYHGNHLLLAPVIYYLIKMKLGLIIVSDKEVGLPSNQQGKIKNLSYYKWAEDTANLDIIKGDIFINPKSDKGKWKYKSNNKTLTAWALGLPVATNVEELTKFLGEEERIKEVAERTRELKDKWDIKISVEELKKIINDIKQKKDGVKEGDTIKDNEENVSEK